MTPDLSLLSGFARGVLLSLHVRDTCLHSGSWLLSGFASAKVWGSMHITKSLSLRNLPGPQCGTCSAGLRGEGSQRGP